MKIWPQNTSIDTCFHLLLTTVSPLQTVLDRPGVTHEFCNRQAIIILKNDGFASYADLLAKYRRELDLGVYWADKGWKNIHHYLDPLTGKGLWQFANAVVTFESYYRAALAAGWRRDPARAAFFLGAAAHLVQDLCVPHHARARLFDGHKQYETWVEERREHYSIANCGLYSEGLPAASLLLANARIAADFLDWTGPESSETERRQATEVLLALAQRTTAGLLWHFAEAIKATGPLDRAVA